MLNFIVPSEYPFLYFYIFWIAIKLSKYVLKYRMLVNVRYKLNQQGKNDRFFDKSPS